MIEFHILGPLRVVIDGTELLIATRRQRALLVLLLMNVGRVVPSERLIDQLWDGSPPPQGAVTLRSYVSNLRQALGGSTGFGSALVTRGAGYALDVPEDTVDAARLTRAAQEGRDHLRHDRPAQALEAFDLAVGLWGGDPLAEISDHEVARGAIASFTETYLGAAEGRFEALLAVGRHLDALPDLEAFVADHPLREGPRALLMLALYRAGRAPEALEVHRAFQALLREELGIDSSARLLDLYRRILERDPALAAPSPTPAAGEPAQSAGAVIVGRTRELSLVTTRLDTLTAGSGSLLLIAGEPGIGKTTLLEALELQARGRGVSVHTGRSPAATGAPAFWVWSQVVDSIAAGLDDDALRRACAGPARPVAQLSTTVAERTGQTAPLMGGDPQALRFLLYEAVSAFLRQARQGASMVITLDDIHWADLPSLELISYLTPTLASQPILLAAAYRDLPTERTDALDATLATVSREDVAYELALTGLARGDVAALMETLLGAPAGNAEARAMLLARLHERTGGNPFFIRQLARLLGEAGADVDLQAMPAPPGVRHVVAHRLAGLPRTTQDLLGAAAVVGRDFDVRTVASAAGTGSEAAMDALDQAVRHALVEPGPDRPLGGDYRFVHALVQEVLLDGLPAGRAARLHADVAAQLQREGTGNPDELARHLWAARELVGAAAVPALVAAADAATAVYAVEQAETHLRHALDLLRTDSAANPSTELSVLLRLFRLIVTGRGWGDVDVPGVMDRAMELAEAGAYNDSTARLWWSLIFFLLDRNDPSYVNVADSMLAAIDETPAGTHRASSSQEANPAIGPASRAVVHLASIFSALARNDRVRGLEHLRTARRHVEAAPAAELAAYDEHLHVMLLIIEGYWAALNGDHDGYRSTTEAAVALADADGRPFPRAVARTLAAASGPYVGEAALVQELSGQALELAERFRFGWLASLATCLRGWADAHLEGPHPDVVNTIETLLSQVVADGHRGNESILRLLLADVHVLGGQSAAAREALLRARDNPGPYPGLIIDLVDARLDRLDKT